MRVVMASLDDEAPCRDEDCWQHLTVGVTDLATCGAAVRRFVERADAVSVAVVPGPDETADPAGHWFAVEELLEHCGRAGAVAFLADPLVRHLDEDDSAGPGELAGAVAEASGAVLLVVVAEQRVTAAKPDGRAEWVDCQTRPPVPDEAFCAAFLTRYIDDPADLAAAMGGAAATRG